MKDKIIKNKTFPYFLGFTALLIAICAAVFSVYGIGNLFAGAAISAMIMAGSLEIGKLVATTFLYRYWSKSIGLVKTYLTVAVIALMIITSAGIFGFLSAAYQKSSLTYKLNQEKIVATENSKGYYSNLIASASSRIKVLNETRTIQENRLSEALKDPMLTRNPIQLRQIQDQTVKLIDQANEDIKIENSKIEQAQAKMQSIDEQVNNMKISGIEKKDIQTFKFLADALGVSLDTVAKWFIISLIFVFDPLAVALILAYNVVIYRKEDDRVYDTETEKTILNISEKQFKYTEPKTVEKVDLEDNKKTQFIPAVQEVITPQKTEEVTVTKQKDELPVIEKDIRPQEEIMNIEPKSSSNATTPPTGEMSAYYKAMFKK